MKYNFIILDKALNEIKDAIEWYNNQRKGLGDSFIKDLEKQFNLISKNPKIFKRTYKVFREVLLNKFPFLIVYFIDESNAKIVITSVFHTSRDPENKF